MKKIIMSIVAVLMMFFGSTSSMDFVNAQKPTPSYAKWGNYAMRITKEKYPNAKIIDYLHIGRKTGTTSSTESFKLWLRENNKEFGVFVDIEFNNQTEKVLQTTFKETSR
jgi:hypothetical protein